MAKPKPRDRIVEALMALAAERRWSDVALPAIAERAGVSLAELRAQFDDRLSILAEYLRQVDESVLKKIDPALAQEAPRERLFDILFSRFEAHAPHKRALANIGKAALADPLFALQLNGLVTQSMAWMLAAAGIPASGRRGLVRAQGLTLVWARVMRVFLEDDDPGLARTMAALDKRLREAEGIASRLEWLDRIVENRGRRPEAVGETAPAAGTEVPGADLPEGHPS